MNKNEFIEYAKANFLTEEKLIQYKKELEKQKKKCTKIKMSERPYKIRLEYELSGVKMGMQPYESYIIENSSIDYNNIFDVHLSYNEDDQIEISVEYTGNAEGFYGFQHFLNYIEGNDIIRLNWQYKVSENGYTTIKTLREEIKI